MTFGLFERLQKFYFVALYYAKDVVMMELAQCVLLLLRSEFTYRLRRLRRRWRWKLRNFVKYTLVELLVILGFVAVFVAVWAFCFAR